MENEFKPLEQVLSEIEGEIVSNPKEMYSVSTGHSREYSSEGDRDCILDLWPCIITLCPCTSEQDCSPECGCVGQCMCEEFRHD